MDLETSPFSMRDSSFAARVIEISNVFVEMAM